MNAETHRRGRRTGPAFLAVVLLVVLTQGTAHAATFDAMQVIDLQSPQAAPRFSTGVELDGAVVYEASDPIRGRELWRTDGTVQGTSLVRDINPGRDGSNPHQFVRAGDLVFFYADDGVHNQELWVTDGTAEGTKLLVDIWQDPFLDDWPNTRYLVSAGGSVFFNAPDAQHGFELWKSDGTTAGTTIVKDIIPGEDSGYPIELAVAGGDVYFNATDGVHGPELWRSDGTESGTTMVKDIIPGPDGISPSHPANVGGEIFFSPTYGSARLWKSDGSEAGTMQVKNFMTGQAQQRPTRFIADLNGAALFVAEDGTHGKELWRSDGTEAGTELVKDIQPGSGDGTGGYLWGPTVDDDKLFFPADDGVHGNELWRSDGTEAGTELVKDIAPGPANSDPRSLSSRYGLVFLDADDGSHGRELWESDGTGDGASLVEDVRPGSDDGADASSLVGLNGALLFAGSDGTSWNLWRADSGPDTTPPDTAFESGPADGSAGEDATFGFRGTPGDTAALQCQIDFAPFADCMSPVDLSALPEGIHTIAVRSVDATGNIDPSPAIRTFKYDLMPPDTKITRGPREGTTINVDTATFWAYGGLDTVRLQCKLDAGSFTDCTSPHTFSDLSDGPHEVAIRAVDEAGHVDPTPATRRFEVETTLRLPEGGRRNLGKGTLLLLIRIPGRALLEVDPARESAGLFRHAQVDFRRAQADIRGADGPPTERGRFGLTLTPTPKGLRVLERRAKGPGPGKLDVAAVFTYTPNGGSPSTQRHRYTLKLR